MSWACISWAACHHFLLRGWCIWVHPDVFPKRRDRDSIWGGGFNQEKWVDYWRAVGRKPEEVIYNPSRGGTVHCVTACWSMGAMRAQQPPWIVELCDPECNAVCDPLCWICALCCQWKIYCIIHAKTEAVQVACVSGQLFKATCKQLHGQNMWESL